MFGVLTGVCARACRAHRTRSPRVATLFPNESEEVVDAPKESVVQRSLPSPQLPVVSGVLWGARPRDGPQLCRPWGGSIATVAFDYLLLTNGEVYTTQEWNDNAMPEERA